MNSNGAEAGDFSPLRDGYRWGEDGHLIPRRDEEPFVPEGDKPYQEGATRFRAAPPRASRSKPGFDPDYEPLLASVREVRRRLLYPWRMFPRDRIAANIDPFVAKELLRQELFDAEFREDLEKLLGKEAVNRRVVLLLEARYNDHAREELGDALAKAYATADAKEVAEWDAARKIFARYPAHLGRLMALIYVRGFWIHEKPFPPRGEVLEFLESRSIPVSRKNAARDIFTGILSKCPRRRAGRKKSTRRRP